MGSFITHKVRFPQKLNRFWKKTWTFLSCNLCFDQGRHSCSGASCFSRKYKPHFFCFFMIKYSLQWWVDLDLSPAVYENIWDNKLIVLEWVGIYGFRSSFAEHNRTCLRKIKGKKFIIYYQNLFCLVTCSKKERTTSEKMWRQPNRTDFFSLSSPLLHSLSLSENT